MSDVYAQADLRDSRPPNPKPRSSTPADGYRYEDNQGIDEAHLDQIEKVKRLLAIYLYQRWYQRLVYVFTCVQITPQIIDPRPTTRDF